MKLLVTTASCLAAVSGVFAANDCQPVTWAKAAKRATITGGFTSQSATLKAAVSTTSASSPSDTPIQPGQINCRAYGRTYDDVNYYTCTQLADMYGIVVDTLFKLNPDLETDCSNIKPNSEYCVDGFIEPLRATDGLCGPKHKNATCLGTDNPCCNANTFTCGSTDADCAPGTCYEGLCPGDSIYTTDGTCGAAYGHRECAGQWGECCSTAGKCGNGTAFCGIGNCQSGNCTRPTTTSTAALPWHTGNTTDGSCGGPNKYTCNVVYGNCCNKNGFCGSLPTDCGTGCQPVFGKCT